MGCVSGKKTYKSKHLAEQALIAARSGFFKGVSSGPINVYQCEDCGEWHLTSKGEVNPLLKDEHIIKEIRRQQEADFWKNKF